MDFDKASNVRFHRISEFHSVSNALHVIVEPGNGYQIKPNDWVGLYVVGWSSVDQYATKQNVAYPESTLFPAESLPRDSAHFYQLCYFDSKNDLHGISTTFSFVEDDEAVLTDLSGDGVIVDMNDYENDDVVLVKTSKSQLEQALSKTLQEKLQLQKLLSEQKESSERLLKQNEMLTSNLNACQAELKVEREKNLVASEEKTKACDRLASLEAESKKSLVLVEELRAAANVSRSSDEAAAIFALDNERLLKRVVELEQQVATQLNEIERLKEQMNACDDIRLRLHSENQELTGRVRELGNQVTQHQRANDALDESLRNAEERLSVNEDLKRMLQQEVDSLMAVQRSLAARLEDAKTEGHSLKTKVTKLEKELEAKQRSHATSEERNAEMERAQSDSAMKLLSQKKLTEEAEAKIAELKQRLKQAAEEYRSLYKQVYRRESGGTPAPVEPPARPIVSSLPPTVKCPICEEFIESSQLQAHFQIHDEQQSSDPTTSKCPVCLNYYPVNEIQSHAESHFE